MPMMTVEFQRRADKRRRRLRSLCDGLRSGVGPSQILTVKDPDRLRQQTEEAHASRHNGPVPALQAEIDKLAWCDTLVFQFPLWWFGLPAFLKAWVDRVFAV